MDTQALNLLNANRVSSGSRDGARLHGVTLDLPPPTPARPSDPLRKPARRGERASGATPTLQSTLVRRAKHLPAWRLAESITATN